MPHDNFSVLFKITAIKTKLNEAKSNNDLPIVICVELGDSEKELYVKEFCESMNYKVADEGLLNGEKIYTILEP